MRGPNLDRVQQRLSLYGRPNTDAAGRQRGQSLQSRENFRIPLSRDVSNIQHQKVEDTLHSGMQTLDRQWLFLQSEMLLQLLLSSGFHDVTVTWANGIKLPFIEYSPHYSPELICSTGGQLQWQYEANDRCGASGKTSDWQRSPPFSRIMNLL